MTADTQQAERKTAPVERPDCGTCSDLRVIQVRMLGPDGRAFGPEYGMCCPECGHVSDSTACAMDAAQPESEEDGDR